MVHDQVKLDLKLTLENKAKIKKNKNLLFWYKNLYQTQFSDLIIDKNSRVLEVGSGTSPLKFFYPDVLSSDILHLEYLDYVFDAMEIDNFEKIGDESIDIITVTNVLHHIKDPILFIEKAKKKLKQNGRIIFTEPYYSTVSNVIYRYLHHEATDMNIQEHKLSTIEGPLSSANMALPYLIFYKKPNWRKKIEESYFIKDTILPFYTSLSYMMTGGISRRIPIPTLIYKLIFKVDVWLAKTFPNIFASFFSMILVKK